MSKSLDPDQARHFVWPDLGPNFCKGYQQMTLGGTELTNVSRRISSAESGCASREDPDQLSPISLPCPHKESLSP